MDGSKQTETLNTKNGSLVITNNFARLENWEHPDLDLMKKKGFVLARTFRFKEVKKLEKTQLEQVALIKVINSRERMMIPFTSQNDRDSSFNRITYRRSVRAQNH